MPVRKLASNCPMVFWSVDTVQLSAEKVKKFRQQQGWSQELLAKAAGLSLRTVQRVEKDGNSSPETQLALAAAFDVSPQAISEIPEELTVNWKKSNIMQSLLALVVVFAAIAMLLSLAGPWLLFVDGYSVLFLLLFMYAATVIAFGAQGLWKSLLGLRYLFSSAVQTSPASEWLLTIYRQQLRFLYGGAVIALLIGVIAIHGNYQSIASDAEFHQAYAVNILILFYAALLGEGILRPLIAKLSQ